MRKSSLVGLGVCLFFGRPGSLPAEEKSVAGKDEKPEVRPVIDKGITEKAIIEKAIAAHGGEASVAKLKTVRIKVKGKQALPGRGDVPFTLEDAWQLPNQYRTEVGLEVNGKTITQILTLNGEKGWISINGQSQEMDPKTIAEMKEQLYAESLDKLFPLRAAIVEPATKGYEMTTLEERKIDEKDAVGIKVASQGHKDVSLYFDKTSGLLVMRAHRIQDTTGKEVLQEVFFRDFKELDGLKHFQKIIAYRNGQKVIEGEVVEVKFFDKLDEKLFGKPDIPAKG